MGKGALVDNFQTTKVDTDHAFCVGRTGKGTGFRYDLIFLLLAL